MLEGIAIEDRIDDASCRGNVSLLRPRVPHIVFRSFQIVAPHCNGIPTVACFLNGVTIVAWYRMGSDLLHAVYMKAQRWPAIFMGPHLLRVI